MCHASCLAFGRTHIRAEDVRGRDVVEVGSLDVNGSLRGHVESLGPARYVGADVQPGPGVDVVCDAGDLVSRFGEAAFDLVLSTEMLEHARDWRRVVSNLKRLARRGGVLLVTTRSLGFPYHGYPYDFWRYEPDDLRQAFSDCTIELLERDPEAPGVFLRARVPEAFAERDLSTLALHSMLRGRRARDVGPFDVAWLKARRAARRAGGLILPERVKRFIKERLLGEHG